MSKCKNTNFDEWEITQLGENIPSWWMKQLDDCSWWFKMNLIASIENDLKFYFDHEFHWKNI
jgi:hypothetical protein